MMRISIKGLVVLISVISISAQAAVTGIEPEVPSRIQLSSIDVNRIVCPAGQPVTNYSYSKEKGLVFEHSGENIFVKFPVLETEAYGKKEKAFYSGNAELYLSCGSSVYTLIFEAKKIPGQTVYLSDTAADMKKANEYVSAKSKDDLMLDLIQAIIENRVPRGFKLKDDEHPDERYKDITVSTTKQLTGGGYTVKALVLRSDKQVSITETELMKLKMIKNAKAIAIMSPVFTGITTAYIVEGVAQ